MQIYAQFIIGILVIISLSGCNPVKAVKSMITGDDGKIKDLIDQNVRLTRDDYRELLNPPKEKKEDDKIEQTPNIPEISEIITAPNRPNVTKEKTISLSITEDVPLKDVLIELARLGDIDMEIDAGIKGGIILRVKDRPFTYVLERIVKLGNLRLDQKDGIISVQRDLPYQQNYAMDFLNTVRSSSGSIETTTSVLGSESESLKTGSSNTIETTSDGDLWKSIEDTLTNILENQNVNLSSISDSDSESTTESSFTINKQASVISVNATKRQHIKVNEYLNRVKRAVTAQVIIEAKLVEVTLNESFKSGIDWGTIRDASLGLGLSFTPSPTIDSAAGEKLFTLKANRNTSSGGLATALNLVEKFGVTRTLSSPRINALNNQQAVLTFAKNEVYFTLDVSETSSTDSNGATVTNVSVDSTVNSVPIGVILALQPSIDLDNNEVTLSVRPTLSRLSGAGKNDPAVDIEVANIASKVNDPTTITGLNITSTIPEVEVKELDSIMRLKSGEVMVIGGLIEQKNVNTDNGVPFLSRIPFFGNLVKGVEKTDEIVETVIFIKATIIDPSPKVTKPDQIFYKEFFRDRHPLTF